MYFKDGGYYYVRKNKWIHIGNDRMSATARYRTIEHGLSLSVSALPAWFEMERYYHQVYWSSRKNAKKRNFLYELTREQYDALVKRADGHCEVTGIVFELSITDGAARRPFAPSLDRIDSSKHYTIDNCRLVCGIVNAALGAWGEKVFWKMIRMAKKRNIETASEA